MMITQERLSELIADGWRAINGGEHVVKVGDKVIVMEGSPVIAQSGGWILTYDSSAPVITQGGGLIKTCDSSKPVITQGGGHIVTYGSSAPVITRGQS